MGIISAAGGRGLGQVNPLEMMRNMFELRNMQYEFGARQAGSGIIASHDPNDIDGMLSDMRQSPYASYLLPQMQGLLQQRQTDMETRRGGAALAQQQFATARDAWESLERFGPDDPAGFKATGQAIANQLPEGSRGYFNDYLNMRTGDNPDAATLAGRRLAGRMGAGMSPEQAWSAGTGGLPVTSEIAGQPVGGVRPIGGGGAITYPGVTPGAGGPGGPQAAPAPASYGQDFLGSPLYTGTETAPAVRTNPATGFPMLTPNQETAAAEAMKGHSSEAYMGNQQLLTSLERMDGAYDNMARGGGFLAPGPSAAFRNEVAGLSNVWARVAGNEPPFDPSQVASVQEFLKETERLKGQVTNQFYGAGRHAAQTITDAGRAVPSIENTIMAGKAIISSLKAATEWNNDLYKFENAWLADPRHGGNIFGADVAFAATHKAEDYSKAALAEIGMKPGGAFINTEAVRHAMDNGWLTYDQAENVLQSQFKIPKSPR